MGNIVQELNDSAVGIVIGTALHTLGAIGLLGGLIAYIAWHRGLRRGQPHPHVYQWATFLTYFSIVVNLLGGFMRTFMSDHPPIEEFGKSAWVRAIAIKHVFIFVAMGAAVFLVESVARRHAKAQRAGRLDKESMTGHTLGVLLVVLGIVVAAILGAVSTVLPVGAAEPMEDDHGAHTTGITRYANATGQLSGLIPTQVATTTGSFEVAAGTLALNATFVWDPAVFCIRLHLLPPGGNLPADPCEAPAFEVPPATTAVRTVNIANPAPGTWSYVIDGQAPVQATWTLSIAMPTEGSGGSVFATVTLAPGGAYEINTQMPKDGTIHWDWSSSAVLHFNVHSHFDGQVQDYVDRDVADDDASFKAARAGGYSLYWTNGGAVPITLTYETYGDFTLDSIFAG